MNAIFHDIRYGVRMMLKHRSITLIAVLALGLGIGANTAIFSVVNAVLLRPLPYKDPARLVTVLHDGSKPVAPSNFFDWREQSQSFESMAAAQVWEPSLTGREQPERLHALQMTAGMFSLLGVNPSLGRTFAQTEDQPGNEHVVVLSHRLWQRGFGGDMGIINRQITLDGESYTVIGVMPEGFQFAPFWATRAEIWSPLNLTPRINDRRGQSLRVFARLKPGVTREQAQSEMMGINRRLAEQYPNENKGLTVSVDSLHEKVVGKTRPALMILLGAVGFVLLIACANVANLMMARATARQKEIAVRTALGATRARIIRQMLTESVLLSLVGGAFGLFLAVWGIEALVSLGPDNLPRLQTIGLDAYVLGFTLALSVLTGLIFGLFPALQTVKHDLNESLKEGGRASSTGGKRRNRVRRLLVVSEMALAVMLLIGGGLMIRSFLRLLSVDPGFNPQNVLTMTVGLAGSEHSTGEKRAAFFNRLMERVEALPGVQSASAINHLPLGGDTWTFTFAVEGRPAPAPGEKPGAVYRVVRPKYFQTMNVTLLRGRDFTERDTESSPGAVIINEALARRYFVGEEPVGRRITVGSEKFSREIVGVAMDAKQDDWTAEPKPEMYLPHLQATSPQSLTLVIRTGPDPLRLAPAVQSEVWSIDKNLPVSEIRSMEDVASEAIGQQRFNMLLLGVFASVALILAVVGIYGVTSYAVTERTHEIGVRMALGAQTKDVLGMILRQGMMLAGLGIIAGLAGAFLITQLMSSLLFGVSATDPVTFIAIPLLLAIVALVACLVPARRATRVDPTVALRYE